MTVPNGLLMENYGNLHTSIFQYITFAFSALTLLLGKQEGHPACKNRVVRWHGYLSGARCK